MQYSKVSEVEIKIFDQSVKVNDMILFPHGFDGFHLWEAGIVLTRYLHTKLNEFKDKSILELGTGVGITGIYLTKHAKAQRVLMTDYNNQVLANAMKNGNKNAVKCEILNLDWTKNKDFEFQFDYIVGADLIYTGAPLKALYETVSRFLTQGGTFYLLVPTQRQAADEFFSIVKQDGHFAIQEELLEDSRFYEPALHDPKESSRNYPGLAELKFYIYTLTKI